MDFVQCLSSEPLLGPILSAASSLVFRKYCTVPGFATCRAHGTHLHLPNDAAFSSTVLLFHRVLLLRPSMQVFEALSMFLFGRCESLRNANEYSSSSVGSPAMIVMHLTASAADTCRYVSSLPIASVGSELSDYQIWIVCEVV
jgi:hypothetical protein